MKRQPTQTPLKAQAGLTVRIPFLLWLAEATSTTWFLIYLPQEISKFRWHEYCFKGM